MLIVRIELHSAITGKVTEIGRAIIANDGTGTHERGNYEVKIGRRVAEFRNLDIWKKPQRSGRVEDHPRLAYSVWELVRRCLNVALGRKADADPEPMS